MTRKMILLGLIILMLAILGCEGKRGPLGPPGPAEIFVTGEVRYCPFCASQLVARVFISNVPSFPNVSINSVALPFDGSSDGCLSFTSENLDVSLSDTVKLSVNFIKLEGDSGEAEATAILPGQFEITSHEPYSEVILPLGSHLSVEWTSAFGADGYAVNFGIRYCFLDTLGNENNFAFEVDTIVADTSINFSSSAIFPDLAEIDTVTSSYGYFYLIALSGPCLFGEKGNVTGDGIGFFLGLNEGEYFDIFVGGSQLLAREKDEQKYWFRRFFEEKLLEFNINYTFH